MFFQAISFVSRLAISALSKLSIKPIKHWIDSNFRAKVKPVPGSVLYSDLYLFVEHSGIYLGNREISNISVTGFAEGTVESCGPRSFTDKAVFSKKIYVSCDGNGAVGSDCVGVEATSHIGERNFYGLIFKNCHAFSTKCLQQSPEDHFTFPFSLESVWEPTIRILKQTAKKKIGATKWRLWDWQNSSHQKVESPSESETENLFQNLILNKESIEAIKREMQETDDYLEEIADENLPQEVTKRLNTHKQLLTKIKQQYDKAKGFIEATGFEYSFNDLQSLSEDFESLAQEMLKNRKISEVIEKLGRSYISPIKKQKTKIDRRLNNELYGIHKSNDLSRLLPCEIVNFEDEDLEYLFYSKYLEENLLSYELIGNGTEEYSSENAGGKGPVVACLDTSGSMNGRPLLKAKALLLATSKILKKENRSLHIILFGSANEIKELNVTHDKEGSQILSFLMQGFGGGTNFETPLTRAMEIIQEKEKYNKADILMITDGQCDVSTEFKQRLSHQSRQYDFSVYSVICEGTSITNDFSDEVICI